MDITTAVVREKEQPFVIEELELEEPQADEVLVRIVGAGVCHTDLIVRDLCIEANTRLPESHLGPVAPG